MTINREQAEALIEEQLINVIQQDAPQQSVFMSLARKLPNMTSKQTRIPVLDMLPMAYWVTGDTGFKQTTQQAWENIFLTAEELAVIVPIPEAVLDDASFDIFGEINPRIVESIGALVDQAIIFGVNKPASWPADIITRARQAGNNVAVGGGIDYDTFMGDAGVIAKIETDGYIPTGGIASMAMRAKLRGIKTDTGVPLFKSDMQGATPYALDGSPLYFPQNGGMISTIAQLILGDWKQCVWALRQDVTVKILDQAVIQDPNTKEIVFNLAQQDMIALRVVFRMGWAMSNPATRMDSDRTGCAFAYLEPSTPATTQAVTFTVQDSSSVNVADAKVEVDGARLKTDASGQAVFNLRAGTYKYKAKKSGYITAEGTVTVAAAAVSQAVTLNTVT